MNGNTAGARRRQGGPAPEGAESGISRPEQLDALATPVRLEVLDAIWVLDPCSVGDVSEHLGRSRTSLYHHVELLLARGLISERGLRATGRRPEMLYGIDHNMRILYDPADPENVSRVSRIARAITRTAARDFEAAFRPATSVVEGRRRNLWAARAMVWLSDADLEEVNALLQRIVELTAQGVGPGRRLHAVSWVLAPGGLPEEEE